MRNVNPETQSYGDIMSRYGIIVHSELSHHGIKGMKWGIRRYQNADGSLTPEGERRYYSYEGAKRARHLKNAGTIASVGSAAGGLLSAVGSLYKDSKTPENIKNSKEYQRSQAIKTAGQYGTAFIGMLAGMGIEAKNSKRLDDIIKKSSKQEFDKIKNDKHFKDNPVVKNRIHFDNFEKRNRITSNTSNQKKAELYVKEMFKKNPPVILDPEYGEYEEQAWLDSKLAGDWYGIKDKDLEKMCWKYHNQYITNSKK